jgi:hypothetical protein
MTLGMLEAHQAKALKEAGLDYYNHNLDSAPEFYASIISTRTYQDRLDTLGHVRQAGINVCCGGIVGMGESRVQRAGLLAQLASLDPYPESVPINNLVQVAGTPLEGTEPLDPFEFVRTIAVARITMPRTMVRLSAGREQMDETLQALCFVRGRCQFDLLWRQTADHQQPAGRTRPQAVRAAGFEGAGRTGGGTRRVGAMSARDRAPCTRRATRSFRPRAGPAAGITILFSQTPKW